MCWNNGYTLEFTPSVPWDTWRIDPVWTIGTPARYHLQHADANSTSGYFYAAAAPARPAHSAGLRLRARLQPVALNTFFDVAVQYDAECFNGDSGQRVRLRQLQRQPANSGHPLATAAQRDSAGTTAVCGDNHYIYVELTTGLESSTSVPLAGQHHWYAYTVPGRQRAADGAGAVP